MNELQSSEPVLEVLAATIGLVAIIIVHGAGMRAVNGRFSRAWVRVTAGTPHWRVNLLLALVVGSLTLLHLVETLIWAVPLYLFGILPNMRDSYYFVLESYTTLGVGPVALPERWRLVGPIIAMSGLFTFGWTGSVLVSIMTDFGRFDRSRASIDAEKQPEKPE